MSTFDNKQACIDMWTWIASQPDKTTKGDYFEANPHNYTEEFVEEMYLSYNFCFACLEDIKRGAEEECCRCPIYPNSRKTGIMCNSLNEPYDKWNIKKTQANAQKFLDFVIATWED